MALSWLERLRDCPRDLGRVSRSWQPSIPFRPIQARIIGREGDHHGTTWTVRCFPQFVQQAARVDDAQGPTLTITRGVSRRAPFSASSLVDADITRIPCEVSLETRPDS